MQVEPAHSPETFLKLELSRSGRSIRLQLAGGDVAELGDVDGQQESRSLMLAAARRFTGHPVDP
jgi:hypothetical protein